MHTENKTKKLKSSHHLGTLMKPFVLVRKLNSMEDLRIASVPLTYMISKLMFLSSFFKNLLKEKRKSSIWRNNGLKSPKFDEKHQSTIQDTQQTPGSINSKHPHLDTSKSNCQKPRQKEKLENSKRESTHHIEKFFSKINSYSN